MQIFTAKKVYFESFFEVIKNSTPSSTANQLQGFRLQKVEVSSVAHVYQQKTLDT